MPNNLNFSTLVPEHDTFTDKDGQEYEFKAQVDFGAVDLARVNQLRSQIQALLETLSQHSDDETAAQNLETCAARFLTLILPDLPQARVAAITLGQKTKIVEWWTARQRGELMGEALANQPKA